MNAAIDLKNKNPVYETLGFCLVDHQGFEPWTP